MTPADRRVRSAGKVLAVDAHGRICHRSRAELALLFQPGDVVVANDAATLPASLHGMHIPRGAEIEIRLAGWGAANDYRRFMAVAFGAGDYRTPTEKRPLPPEFAPGDRLRLGPLVAVVEGLMDHPRLLALRFSDDRAVVLAGLARHGRPIQYAHVPAPLALWDTWTSLAARPVAFEPPSAGFALDWRILAVWRQRGIKVVTLTHAAGLSSTGDSALDRRLPFDEPYDIPAETVAAINQARTHGARVIAIGTTVVRALEHAAMPDGAIRTGQGLAQGRIAGTSRLRIVDAILTGLHQPGESHFELLRAFASDSALGRMLAATQDCGYRSHEFGDAMVIERQTPALETAHPWH